MRRTQTAGSWMDARGAASRACCGVAGLAMGSGFWHIPELVTDLAAIRASFGNGTAALRPRMSGHGR
jgi:hypothetical protein